MLKVGEIVERFKPEKKIKQILSENNCTFYDISTYNGKYLVIRNKKATFSAHIESTLINGIVDNKNANHIKIYTSAIWYTIGYNREYFFCTT